MMIPIPRAGRLTAVGGTAAAAAVAGIEEVTIGLTHRGRLNILANVVGNSTERIFAGFEGTVHLSGSRL